jgi:hypothetical protein
VSSSSAASSSGSSSASVKSLGIDPSPETFQIFIDGCIAASYVAYGKPRVPTIEGRGVSLDHDVSGNLKYTVLLLEYIERIFKIR